MKTQWSLIFILLFALMIAVFAVMNVDSVTVNYVLGVSQIPLILVILGSALVGGLMIGLFGIIRQYKLQRKVKLLQAELNATKGDPLLTKEAATGLPNKDQHITKTEKAEFQPKDDILKENLYEK